MFNANYASRIIIKPLNTKNCGLDITLFPDVNTSSRCVQKAAVLNLCHKLSKFVLISE